MLYQHGKVRCHIRLHDTALKKKMIKIDVRKFKAIWKLVKGQQKAHKHNCVSAYVKYWYYVNFGQQIMSDIYSLNLLRWVSEIWKRSLKKINDYKTYQKNKMIGKQKPITTRAENKELCSSQLRNKANIHRDDLFKVRRVWEDLNVSEEITIRVSLVRSMPLWAGRRQCSRSGPALMLWYYCCKDQGPV